MNIINKLEQRLFEAEKLTADDKYISDGYILVSKEFLKSDVLKQYKNEEKEMSEMMSNIPYEIGEFWDLPDNVELRSNHNFAFMYDETYGFDYNFIAMFEEAFFFSCLEYYISKVCLYGEECLILKIFDEKGNFYGLIPAIKRTK